MFHVCLAYYDVKYTTDSPKLIGINRMNDLFVGLVRFGNDKHFKVFLIKEK